MTAKEKAEYAANMRGGVAMSMTWKAWIRAVLRSCIIACVLFFCCWGFGVEPEKSARLAAGVMAITAAGTGVGTGILILLVSIAVAIVPTKEGEE